MPQKSNIDYLNSFKGFDKKFISSTLQIDPMDLLSEDIRALLPTIGNKPQSVLHYDHLSVYFNTKRKIPFFSAYNIDGAAKDGSVQRGQFEDDPRLPADKQLNVVYDLIKGSGDFSKGHMAAHAEMAWGDNAQEKCDLTFFHANAVPQNQKLNGGLWSQLEAYVRQEAAEMDQNQKISLITGPVIKSNDPSYVKDSSVKLPLLFFKIIIFKHKGTFRATAFMMSQKKGLEESGMIASVKTRGIGDFAPVEPFEDFTYKEVFQVSKILLAQVSKLNLEIPNVEWIEVPENKHQLKVILDTGSAGDIKRGSTENFVPQVMDTFDFFDTQRQEEEKFKLNLLF